MTRQHALCFRRGQRSKICTELLVQAQQMQLDANVRLMQALVRTVRAAIDQTLENPDNCTEETMAEVVRRLKEMGPPEG